MSASNSCRHTLHSFSNVINGSGLLKIVTLCFCCRCLGLLRLFLCFLYSVELFYEESSIIAKVSIMWELFSTSKQGQGWPDGPRSMLSFLQIVCAANMFTGSFTRPRNVVPFLSVRISKKSHKQIGIDQTQNKRRRRRRQQLVVVAGYYGTCCSSR